MNMMTGAQMLVRTLEDLGVERVFGYPGGAVLDIYDALLDSRQIVHILARHEQGAAHAADGYARATGKVGVCLVTSGPGATNTVTGIATAYMDSVPMVVITGQVGTPLIGSDAFQEVDTVGITRPIVKHSYLCKRALDIPKYLRRAFYLAASGRPGPVVVDVPKDCVSPARTYAYPTETAVKLRSYNPTTAGHRGQIRRAAKLLTEAQAPVLLVGGGTVIADAAGPVRELAGRFRLPVAATLMGLGVYPGDDPQFLGMVGMHGTYAANMAMDQSDLVLAVGVRFDDRVTNNLDKFCPHAKIVHVDIDPASISKTVPADIPIVGDAGQVLTQLLEITAEGKCGPQPAVAERWWPKIEAWRAAHPLPGVAGRGDAVTPAAVVRTLWEQTRGAALVVTDVGQHQMFTAQYYAFTRPRQLLTSGGLGTMGYGFPAAIGAAVGCPGQTVCLVTGDGSFQMNLQELSTCLQFRLPLKIFIINNRTLGMVRQWQRMFYRGRISATDLNFNPDFVALAAAYGHVGMRAERPAELAPTVARALALRDRLVVVDISCDPDAMVLPMQQMRGSMADMVTEG